MIYARVDVNFGDHPKALAAGAIARDLWTWGLLYSRKHELDGDLPKEVVLASSWGAGGKTNAKVAAKLVDVGLWVAVEGGWRIVNYSEKNETRDQIDQRRGTARERMRKVRGERSPDVRANAPRTLSEQAPNVRDQIQEPEPEPEPEQPTVVVAPAAPPAKKVRRGSTDKPTRIPADGPDFEAWVDLHGFREALTGAMAAEFLDFVRHHRGKGNAWVNWPDAWAKWQSQAAKWAGERAKPAPWSKPSTLQADDESKLFVPYRSAL